MTETDPIQRFTALYAQHHNQVFAYAVTRAGRDQADEVVAETFLVAWRRFAVLPRGAPLPWLLGTARNVIRARYRDEERQRAVAAELRACPACAPWAPCATSAIARGRRWPSRADPRRGTADRLPG